VTVEPSSFTLVDFDQKAIASLLRKVVAAVGIDRPVAVEVDQTSPLGRVHVVALDPAVRLVVESGALEDPRRLRQFSPTGAANVLGRVLLRARDRLDPAFGDAPADDEVTLGQSSAWDAYAVGRLVRLGFRHHADRQRRLYQFRTRHGFSDGVDAAFDALWDGDALTWADVARLSASAAAAGGRTAA